MKGLFVALGFLTRIPVPRKESADPGDLGRAVPWLPVVGGLVGVLVALAVAVALPAGLWVGALAGLLTWVLITGALHLDGLGDVADGLGASHGNAERFVAVARDPHLGSFGAIAIVLMLLAKLILLSAWLERVSLFELIFGLMLVGAWARWTPLAVGWRVPPLAEGMASRLKAGLGAPVVVVEGLVLAALSLLLAPPLLAAVPFAVLLSLYWKRRLGGVTGDCHGASIEIQEALLLACLVAL